MDQPPRGGVVYNDNDDEQMIDFSFANDDNDNNLYTISSLFGQHRRLVSELENEDYNTEEILYYHPFQHHPATVRSLLDEWRTAVSEGNTERLEELLEEVPYIEEWLLSHHIDREGNTALHVAVRQRNVSMVQFLLHSGMRRQKQPARGEPNQRDDASSHDCNDTDGVDSSEAFISNEGANCNAPSTKFPSETPLGPTLRNQRGETPLMTAVTFHDVPDVLEEMGSEDCDAMDSVRSSTLQIVQLLLENTPSEEYEATDAVGRTALMRAVANHPPPTLLAYGGRRGNTATSSNSTRSPTTGARPVRSSGHRRDAAVVAVLNATTTTRTDTGPSRNNGDTRTVGVEIPPSVRSNAVVEEERHNNHGLKHPPPGCQEEKQQRYLNLTIQIVQALVLAGVQPWLQSGWTLLHWAASHNHLPLTRFLLHFYNEGLPLDLVPHPQHHFRHELQTSTAASLVHDDHSSHDDTSTCTLPTRIPLVKIAAADGQTVLHIAASQTRMHCCDIPSQNNERRTPGDVPDGHKHLFDLGQGASARVVHYEPQQLHRMELVKLLLDAGAWVEAPTHHYGMTPLHAAVWQGQENLPIIQLLLDHGADPCSPRAVHGHFWREARFLLPNQQRVDEKANYRCAASTFLSTHYPTTTLTNPNTPRLQGRRLPYATALDLAVFRNYASVVDCLLSELSHLGDKCLDDVIWPSLRLASAKHHLESFQVLLFWLLARQTSQQGDVLNSV